MRVLSCGPRSWTDAEFVYRMLDKLRREFGFEVVIEGHARGWDRMSGYWARSRGLTNIKERVTQEDYDRWGRYKAPKMRNQRMLDKHKPDLGIAGPHKEGGTADMVDRMLAAGLEVVGIQADGSWKWLGVPDRRYLATRIKVDDYIDSKRWLWED